MALLKMLVFFAVIFSSTIGRPIDNELGVFSFDIHHRFSDTIVKRFPSDELPEKGSLRFYANMVNRDLALQGRRLADSLAPLTFKDGNRTLMISSLGYLHYARVSVGSPDLVFMVALDTGSSLFWLPCDCQNCVKELITSSGETIKLNIYSPSASTSSRLIPCNSIYCNRQLACNSSDKACPYVVEYLSDDTSSLGYLVEDDLQLITDNTLQKRISAKITIGCGRVQTGAFLEGGAPNGLFGLGLSKVAVPSTLASQGLIADSFSLCFGSGTSGRITFGDKGSANQSETPFNLDPKHASYNVSVTKLSVNGNPIDITFHVIFDTGSSFAYLGDPAFSTIAKMYNEAVSYPRFRGKAANLPFEYCYDIRPNRNAFFPSLMLTMKNGSAFRVARPIEPVDLVANFIVSVIFLFLGTLSLNFQSSFTIYCLGIIRSDSIDIIGQNFMTGYRVVFDRERMVLGWENSDCYNFERTSFSSISPPALETTPAGSALPSSNSSAGNPQIFVLPSNDWPLLYPATLLLLKALIVHLFLVQ